ncbi:MAG: DUF4190 domain-containing protein [Acidimicrobiia bacterium]|nr:DUF4190 domain-containing protein [Acidimicrobiia bacterium]
MAVPSMVLGIVGFFCCVTGPIALILGILSLRRINAARGALDGKAFAITGIVLGGLQTAGLFFYIGVIALSAASGTAT